MNLLLFTHSQNLRLFSQIDKIGSQVTSKGAKSGKREKKTISSEY